MIQTNILCDECQQIAPQKVIGLGFINERTKTITSWNVTHRDEIANLSAHFCSPACMIKAFSRQVGKLWDEVKERATKGESDV